MLVWVWALALAGILLKLVLPHSWDRLFVGVYLALGWLFLAALDEVLHTIPGPSLALLAAGGVAYTVGALIYAWDIGRWTDPVWHAFVLAGSVTHFGAILTIMVESPGI
jgi:hemolysin III